MPDLINWSYEGPFYLAAFGLAYLLGSIPFGLLLTRIAGLGDIRRIGSGNIGATNVLRTGHKGLALATLLLDGGKGLAAVVIAHQVGPPPFVVFAAYGALIGHLYPVWLRFRGGKGVATGLGVLLGLAWPVGVAACATWLIVAALFRYSSGAALAAFAAAPVVAWVLATRTAWSVHYFVDVHAVSAMVIGVLVWWAHRANLDRLIRGTEPKIGQKPSAAAAGTDDPPAGGPG